MLWVYVCFVFYQKDFANLTQVGGLLRAAIELKQVRGRGPQKSYPHSESVVKIWPRSEAILSFSRADLASANSPS